MRAHMSCRKRSGSCKDPGSATWCKDDVGLAQAMRMKHDIRFKLMATGLRLAGHKKVGSENPSSCWPVLGRLHMA